MDTPAPISAPDKAPGKVAADAPPAPAAPAAGGGVVTSPLTVGDPVPWFVLPSTAGPEFRLHSVAGRFIVLCFFGSSSNPAARARLEAALSLRAAYDDARLAFFGVSTDARDRDEGRVRGLIPGIRYFWDFTGEVTRQFMPQDGAGITYVLDPTLRVIAALRFDDPRGHDRRLAAEIAALPVPHQHAGVELYAPVLIVPRVFEPVLCRRLIDIYRQSGGEDSGFMRDREGKTVAIIDHQHKRRQDCRIDDPRLRDGLNARVLRRLVPEIQRAFQYRPTRIERHIVACYDAELGGYFRPHRDNTTRGTAHRRFAVTINLNAEEYTGGDLRFPEFGQRAYRAPTGGAVVFSCSLLHEAMPVTSGRRYAFLPFLYDDEGAKLREANNAYLGEGVGSYGDAKKIGDASEG